MFQLPGINRRPDVTYMLLGTYILVWLLMEIMGNSGDGHTLLQFGALFGPYVASGEYWRFFTSTFLHVGLMHLFFNGISLLIFGRIVEGVFGRLRFISIYVTSGLSGSVLSFMFNTDSIGAGASGAIFGVLGSLVSYYTINYRLLGKYARQTLVGILIIGAINLFIGFTTPGIDNWAHIGGFIGGTLSGFALIHSYQAVLSWNKITLNLNLIRTMSSVILILTLILGTLIGKHNYSEAALPYIGLKKVEKYLDSNQYELALIEIDKVIQGEPGIGRAYYMRALILFNIGDNIGALDAIKTSLLMPLDQGERRKAIELLISIGDHQ